MREHIGKANTSRRLEGFIPKPKSADLLRERRAIADCLQERGLCCPQQYSDVVRSGHAWRLLFDRKLLRTGKSTGKSALRGIAVWVGSSRILERRRGLDGSWVAFRLGEIGRASCRERE